MRTKVALTVLGFAIGILVGLLAPRVQMTYVPTEREEPVSPMAATESPRALPPTERAELETPIPNSAAAAANTDAVREAATQYMLEVTGWKEPPRNLPPYEEAWRVGVEEVSQAARELKRSLERSPERSGQDQVNARAAKFLSEVAGVPAHNSASWVTSIQQVLAA